MLSAAVAVTASVLKKLSAVLGSMLIIWVAFYLVRPASTCQFEGSYKIVPVSAGRNVLQAAVAASNDLQQKGLGERDCIQKNAGMLFEFAHSDTYGFWMKDMRFPIDMIWVDSDKKVSSVTAHIAPNTYPKVFYSLKPVQYVLEVPAGQAEAENIAAGTLLRW